MAVNKIEIALKEALKKAMVKCNKYRYATYKIT